MNILTDRPPESVEIGGRSWPIAADFRVGIAFELLMQNTELGWQEKISRALSLYFPKQVTSDLEAAADAVHGFTDAETPRRNRRNRRCPNSASERPIAFNRTRV